MKKCLKKILSLVLCFVMVFGLIACSEKAEPRTKETVAQICVWQPEVTLDKDKMNSILKATDVSKYIWVGDNFTSLRGQINLHRAREDYSQRIKIDYDKKTFEYVKK